MEQPFGHVFIGTYIARLQTNYVHLFGDPCVVNCVAPGCSVKVQLYTQFGKHCEWDTLGVMPNSGGGV